LKNISLNLLAAGNSTRFEAPVKKQWIRIGESPLWKFVADSFKKTGLFEKIVITATPDEITYMSYHGNYTIVSGGKSRQESLQNALKEVDSEYVIVSDIARACIDEAMLYRLLENKEAYDVVVPAIKVSDTVTFEEKTIDREKLLRIQTPQLSKVSMLKKALQSDKEYTDESSAIVAIGGSRGFVEGSQSANKITYLHDLQHSPCLQPPANVTLGGTGFDVHAFDDTKSYMYLCGKKIECGYGFKAHSDGDVAIHALIDAILGASGLGDIGELFPDTDPQYKGIDSKELLLHVMKKIKAFGFELINVDITIIAQQPKLAPYKKEFRFILAKLLELEPIRVNIKATTTEKLGFTGRKEGVAVQAYAQLKYYNPIQG
jgi:2-C-methyl-D-erythritol 4-phosphate cytidylyltransferase/2-C-methyl-D-erythritol 2,4-cyclodiphosphate synthase